MVIRLLSFLFIFSSISSVAQTTVEVLDNEKKGLPNAHITYSSLNKKQTNTILTDINGFAVIPSSFTKENKSFTIYITYIGFEKIDNDTVQAKANIRFVLKEDMVALEQFVVTGQYSPNDPDKRFIRFP